MADFYLWDRGCDRKFRKRIFILFGLPLAVTATVIAVHTPTYFLLLIQTALLPPRRRLPYHTFRAVFIWNSSHYTVSRKSAPYISLTISSCFAFQDMQVSP